jgi:hypothetical protein
LAISGRSFCWESAFSVIGLQYLVWGWWFERIYRSHPVEDDEPAKRLG